MRKYNGFTNTLRHGATTTALIAALAVTGCAHDPSAGSASGDDAPAASTRPLAERTPPPVRTSPLRTDDLNAQLKDDAPLRYVVKPGDTLWDIAGYYLRDPWYWPQLWYDNPDIANPHLIYPGEVLILTRGMDGQPRLRRDTTVHLEPRVREKPLDEAIATIPLDAIRAFLTGPRLVSSEEIEKAPYVVSFIDEHLVGGAGTTAYVRGIEGEAGETYSLVRHNGPYKDPDTNEILGQEALPVGQVQIEDVDDVSTARITRSYREALAGDRLLPLEREDLVRDFYPHAPAEPVEAKIISVYDGVSAIGQYQVVTLSRGRNVGLERGHVLNVFETGRVVRDPVAGGQVRLPPVKSGQMLVFKVDDKVSFGVIMSARRAIHVEDIVRSPAA